MGSETFATVKKVVGAVALVAALPGLAACGQSDDPNLVAGKQLFVEKCGSCHILERAGTKGTQGPDLDQAFQRAKKDGFGESAIEGVVYAQILYPAKFVQGERPDGSAPMPAKLVAGDEARDVAAYVAKVVAESGKDTGLLAEAVKAAGGGEPIAAKDGVLSIESDPGGQLAYVSSVATAPPGPLVVESPNESSVPHNIVIDGKGEGAVVQDGGVSRFEATFEPGEFVFYCSVPGHREAGMEGKLTVE